MTDDYDTLSKEQHDFLESAGNRAFVKYLLDKPVFQEELNSRIDARVNKIMTERLADPHGTVRLGTGSVYSRLSVDGKEGVGTYQKNTR